MQQTSTHILLSLLITYITNTKKKNSMMTHTHPLPPTVYITATGITGGAGLSADYRRDSPTIVAPPLIPTPFASPVTGRAGGICERSKMIMMMQGGASTTVEGGYAATHGGSGGGALRRQRERLGRERESREE
ncbi:hypothetical protein Hanom_Chr12g01161551 [Helianthus anomalus]